MKYNLTPELVQFCKDHGIYIIDDNKRAYRHSKMNTTFFKYPNEYDLVDPITIRFETEPLFTIEIAQSELASMAEFKAEVLNQMTAHGHYNMLNEILQQKSAERRLREKYPTVKIAYEQYSVALALAKSAES